MKHAREITGQMPVGQMAEMADLPGMVVSCLRQWNRGGAVAALEMLRAHMAEVQALATFEALQDLTEVLAPHMRRPLRCHAPHCACVGMDEAAFARFVEEAALGAREDALMLASLLVEARAILPLTDAAERLGLCLHRGSLCARRPVMPDPVSQTRH